VIDPRLPSESHTHSPSGTGSLTFSRSPFHPITPSAWTSPQTKLPITFRYREVKDDLFHPFISLLLADPGLPVPPGCDFSDHPGPPSKRLPVVVHMHLFPACRFNPSTRTLWTSALLETFQSSAQSHHSPFTFDRSLSPSLLLRGSVIVPWI